MLRLSELEKYKTSAIRPPRQLTPPPPARPAPMPVLERPPRMSPSPSPAPPAILRANRAIAEAQKAARSGPMEQRKPKPKPRGFDPVAELGEEELEEAMDILPHKKHESKAARRERFGADVEKTRKQLAVERPQRASTIAFILKNDKTADPKRLKGLKKSDLNKIHSEMMEDMRNSAFAGDFPGNVTLGAARAPVRARDVSEASIASSVGGTSPFEVSRSRSVASERSLSGARGRRSTSRSLPRSPTTVRRELRRKIQRERAEPLTISPVSPVSPPIDPVVETESDYARYLASRGALADEPTGMTQEEYQRKRREIRASELGAEEPSDVEPMTTDGGWARRVQNVLGRSLPKE